MKKQNTILKRLNRETIRDIIQTVTVCVVVGVVVHYSLIKTIEGCRIDVNLISND